MKKVVKYVFLTLMCIVAVSTSALASIQPDDPDAGATLAVTVTDEKGNPIEGASVIVNNNMDQEEFPATDAEGKVTVTDLKAADVQGKQIPVMVMKDGYDTYEGQVDFTTLDPTLSVTLQAVEMSLTITVMDEEYEFIAGATVTFEGQDYTTKENGKVVIEGISGPEYIGQSFTFTVTKEGYETYEGYDEFDSYEANAMATLTAEDPANKVTLNVKVVDEAGAPVEGVSIWVDAAPFENEPTATTDENGEASITSLKDANGKKVNVTVYKDGYQDYEGEADFTTENVATIDVTLKAELASLSLKVMCNEDPVEGATVTFMEQTYTTDENGDVKINNISAPEVIGKMVPYTVAMDGYETYEGEADFTEMMEAMAFAELTGKASLTITVKAGDAIVEGAMVTFLDNDYTSDASGEVKITGINTVKVKGQKVAFTAYKDGYEVYTGEADFTASINATATAELVAAEATVSVKVMDGEDPVAGATVTFDGKEYTTDENGEVKITGINAVDVIGKKVPVTVAKDGYETYEGEADFSETIDAYVTVEFVKSKDDSIGSINAVNAAAKVYDLQGRSIKNMQKGQLYIVNGKKILNR